MLLNNLARARVVLGGLNDNGEKFYPSMFDDDVISLAHGDGVRRPHPDIILRGIQSLLDTNKGSLDDYLYLREHRELSQSIFEDFIDDDIHEDLAGNIAIDFGSSTLICTILQYIQSEEGKISFMVPSSFYHNIPKWFSMYGGNIECFKTKAENDYKLTAEELSWYLDRNEINGIFLQSPTHTGAIYTESDLYALSRIIEEKELWLIVDSVFAGTEFCLDKKTPQIAAIQGDNSRIFTVKSVSKRFNLPNIRIGWCCGERNVINAINSLIINRSASIPKILCDAAAASFKLPRQYSYENNLECAMRVSLITKLIKELNEKYEEEIISIEHLPSAGHGLLISLDNLSKREKIFKNGIKDSIDFSSYALRKYKLVLSPALTMGLDGLKFRITYSSVGLKETYSTAKCLELSLARKMLRSNEINFEPYKGEIDLSGFIRGREIIENAFLNEFSSCIEEFLA